MLITPECSTRRSKALSLDDLACPNAHFLCSASCEWAAVGGRKGLDGGYKATFLFRSVSMSSPRTQEDRGRTIRVTYACFRKVGVSMPSLSNAAFSALRFVGRRPSTLYNLPTLA